MNDVTFTLPAELTIYTAAALRAEVLAAIDATSGDWRVDAGAVDQIDAAGVQLLLSVSRAFAIRERGFALLRPSPVLTQACEQLGVSALLAGSEQAPTARAA